MFTSKYFSMIIGTLATVLAFGNGAGGTRFGIVLSVLVSSPYCAYMLFVTNTSNGGAIGGVTWFV